MNATQKRLLPWAITLGFFVLWELVCIVFRIDVFILPAPTAVVVSLVQYFGPIMANAAQTLFTTLLGFAIAVAFGLLLGLIVGASKTIYDGLYPVMVGFNSIPKVAVVPVLVIWFGIGTIPAVVTAFVISFFPIVVNVATGLATIEPEMQDVMRVLGARKWQIMLKIGVPRSMPYFFASLKVAITLAFIGSVIAETVAANSGIGYLMMAASSRFDVPLVFAGLLVIAVMGIVMYELFAVLERRITFWATRAHDIVS
ncbi:MAG TPA: ABC transporter permease [Alphaproteobacteria bacterium]|nr:ABC transporter permease [Alphaproteobacteria bacterium]